MTFDQQLLDRDRLAREGLYDPAQEHSACGVGLIVETSGTPTRRVVQAAIDALKAVWHRGAVDADGKTGDGAGIQVQVPQPLFRSHVAAMGRDVSEADLIAVGQVFLPRTDLSAQERARVIVEREILNAGFTIYGWRQVPVHISCLGEKANAVRPEVEQVMVRIDAAEAVDEIERKLYTVRRRIENAGRSAGLGELYLCSLSVRNVVYKGMFLAEDLTTFYPDLRDPRFESAYALYHQRYSTNTFPEWKLAQPFRVLAHNGEINTLKGNENWMRAHETPLQSVAFGTEIEDLKPIIQPGSSDTAALDAVFELLAMAGRPAPMVKTILIPEAWAGNDLMPDSHKALYTYCNTIMEPWDGPAAVAAAFGPWVLGGLDRAGLRPMRYALSQDGLLVCGSETGMVRLDDADVVEKGRLGPGEMIAVNLDEAKLYKDQEIKDALAAHQVFGSWIARTERLEETLRTGQETRQFDREALLTRQAAYAQTLEDLELILHPMVADAKEALGSMGDDTPTAVLSSGYRPLHHFFRQNFSQVTNPPIDSLREHRVMTLATRLGNLGNVLDESARQCEAFRLESPVLTNGEYQRLKDRLSETASELDATFDAGTGPGAMRTRLDALKAEAERAVRSGKTHLMLSDRGQNAERAALPMILATGAVHTHLIAAGLRTFVSLNVSSGEALDTHSFAVLIGVGASTVNAYLAQEAVADRIDRGLITMPLAAAMERYRTAVDQGLLKIMSKMGIGVLSSYRGGYNFEAVGLSRTLVAEFFPGVPSRISGIGLGGLQEKVLEAHTKAFGSGTVTLPVGGFYRYRHGGERHAWDAATMHALQSACQTGQYQTYRKYAERVNGGPPTWLRDLLDFKRPEARARVEDVESITSLRKRLVTPGMSLGALSYEAHGTLNVAMNRIGAKSVSGEGGEDRKRYQPDANGDNHNSAIKQVASGRFGVTAEYLNQAREIEIKMAQGAKPGEGGQLPGFKVTAQIAELRHATPGVTLISPPPHHDIYSIEDLAQLIYDLKQINAQARVCVKLVSRAGIGTIAAGVAKAKADVILISANSGGTGASPQTSIKYAGLPFELGLSEAHQVLTLNRLRENVVLRTDGGLRTGRDVVMAAMLGAEEFGIGTASLVALGCIMVRQCHSNTCPVGVCTQDPKLRDMFAGTPENVVNLFSFIAEDVREILASLGFTRLEDVIGRTDLLTQVSRGAGNLDDLDLNPILAKADLSDRAPVCGLKKGQRNEVPPTLDAQIIEDARPLFDRGEKMQLQYQIRNTDRTVGTRLSSQIVRQFGMGGLKEGHLTLKLRGSAGQSLGAFGVQGLRLQVVGDANDYVGKGLSGATITVRPPLDTPLAATAQAQTIIGNTVLYGATSGYLFAAGQAGERFCVRNSGARVVVEGCGSNGCEYMTGGRAVILGPVGENFAAGMTGGLAYIYDADGTFAKRVNDESVMFVRPQVETYRQELRALLERHVQETGSIHARRILDRFDRELLKFWQVVPKEMVDRLEVPAVPEARAA